MRRADDNSYRLGLGLATLLMAIQLAEKEIDERRRTRKQSVLTEKWTVLRTTFPDQLVDLQGYGGTGPSLRQLVAAFEQATGTWPADQRRALLIDVLMGDPFAPYELKVAVDDARQAVHTVAVPLGLDEAEISQLWLVWNDALTTYHPSRWRKPDHRVKHIPALSTDEFVLPPPRAEATDAAASTDAQANDHNLALLAGGSLSASDARKAGAMWLLAPASDAPDDPMPPGRQLLALPLASARGELVKAQMAHTLIVEHGLVDGVTPTTVARALDRTRTDVGAQLSAEQDRNDDDAPRVRTIEAVLAALDLTRDRVQQTHATAVAA